MRSAAAGWRNDGGGEQRHAFKLELPFAAEPVAESRSQGGECEGVEAAVVYVGLVGEEPDDLIPPRLER